MKHIKCIILCIAMFLAGTMAVFAQSRRPIDNRHPLWFVHVDVWNNADPQKIIDLIPADIRPYVCMNLSLSCSYDTSLKRYKKPQDALQTYRSWASVCCRNNMFFVCQPASGGHTHIPDNPANFQKALEIHEQFFKDYPNFLGWNYAEQFWGFNEPNDASSSSDVDRIKLFAALVPMHHKYGGVLTISFCGNIWSHPLNPIGMMKRNNDLLNACKAYPEAILWLYKYTTSANWYNNESVTIGPFISGLAKNYGVRYDNCGWNGAISELCKNDGKTQSYPGAVGIAPVLEQTALNGACVWDGPELIWTECFQNKANSNVDGYSRRNWGTYGNFDNIWVDMFRKIIDGTIHIPSRDEVLARTRVVMKNDISAANDGTSIKLHAYAAPETLYDGLYKQDDPFNARTSNENVHGRYQSVSGYGNNNFLYFKKTGRYATIPIVIDYFDDKAKNAGFYTIKHSDYINANSNVGKLQDKVNGFNICYPDPVIESGDLFVARHKNALVCYYPFSDRKQEYGRDKTTSYAKVPFKYNKCSNMELTFAVFSSAHVKEYSDHVDFYLNNYRNDVNGTKTDVIKINGASSKPTYTVVSNRCNAKVTESWSNGVYTCQVTHCGPIDLRINCRGNNNRSSLAMVDDSPLSASSIKQPNANDLKNQPLVIEAEDFDYKSIKSCVTDAYSSSYRNVLGNSDMGFADMGTNTQAAIKYVGKAITTAKHKIAIKYMATTSGSIKVSVNGTEKTCSYNATASSFDNQNRWSNITLEGDLSASQNNTIIITNVGGKALYIDNVTFTPTSTSSTPSNPQQDPAINNGNYSTDATAIGNAAFYKSNAHYCFYTPYYSSFVFSRFDGTKLAECNDLTIKCGDCTTGYRLDIQVKDKNGNIIKNGTEEYIIGNESAGTRVDKSNVSKSYNLQTLLAEYISKYPDCTLGNIRINTAISNEDTNRQGLYYITINEISVSVGKIIATRGITETNITSLRMYEHSSGYTANTLETISDYEKNIGNGRNESTLYGYLTPVYDCYVDVSGYKSITFTGSNNDVRVFINCSKDGQKYVTVSANGTLDLSQYPYAHINAIKASAWNTTATLNTAVLTDRNGNRTNLTSLPFCRWGETTQTATVTEVSGNHFNFNKEIGQGEVFLGPNASGMVPYNQYFDLTDYDQMTIYGNGGSVRMLFNRMVDEGPLTEIIEPFVNGKVTIDLKSIDNYGFAHLHSIKRPYDGQKGTITSIILTKGGQTAPYYLTGSGRLTQSATDALADVTATTIDITGLTNTTELVLTSANPNCIMIYSEAQGNKNLVGNVFGSRNMVKKSGDYSSWMTNLQDGYNFNSPVEINTVGGATYTRNLTTEYAAMPLPFNLDVEHSGSPEIYTISNVSGNKFTLSRVTRGTIDAGTVIIYRNPNKGETKLYGSKVMKTTEGLNVKPISGVFGWYTAETFIERTIGNVANNPELSAYDVYEFDDNTLNKVTGSMVLKPFRVLFLRSKSANAHERINIEIDDFEATGIEESNAIAEDMEHFNAAGQRINAASRGIHIIKMSNGAIRKVIK